MYNIQLLNKIAKVGTDIFDKDAYTVATEVENPDAIMVRSAVMHDMDLPANLKAIARAGAGVNNIPLEKCAEQGIVVFNTPGANANAVKELTVLALILASRDVIAGAEWAKTLKDNEDAAKAVEKGKSAFAGHEIKGKTLGVIGLGAIGGMVANAASALGMEVIGCDPYVTVEAAWGLSRAIKKANSFDEIYKKCDYITVHVPSTKETKGMLNAGAFAMMKDGVRIINMARADLVNTDDLKAALADGKIARYVTDFPTNETIGVDGIICIPHLGASTEEAEDNCAVMAAKELVEFLENGNIINSVNFPNASMPHSGDVRVCIMHKNVPAVLTRALAVVAEDGLNVENMLNRSRGDYAYTILEISGEVSDEVAADIEKGEGVIRARIIR